MKSSATLTISRYALPGENCETDINPLYVDLGIDMILLKYFMLYRLYHFRKPQRATPTPEFHSVESKTTHTNEIIEYLQDAIQELSEHRVSVERYDQFENMHLQKNGGVT